MSTLQITDEVLHAFADEVGDTGPVAVVGHRTRWRVGGEVDPDARLVRAPSGVVTYQPDEMTVQVRAGTSVADLHAELARRGQRTALPERGGTVGGAVAVGENDLCTLGRGSVRTAVLQVRYVSADGELVTGGGPVVKNVSGFNLPKLLVGSLGSLGLVAEVVLRTNPVPAVSRWVEAGEVDPTSAHDAVLRPSAVLWDGSSTWVLLEGHGADVAAELAALRAIAPFEEVEGPPELPPHRWCLTPAQARSLRVAETGPFVASIGVGTVWAHRPQDVRTPDAASRVVEDRLKSLFDPAGRLNPGRRPGGRADRRGRGPSGPAPTAPGAGDPPGKPRGTIAPAPGTPGRG